MIIFFSVSCSSPIKYFLISTNFSETFPFNLISFVFSSFVNRSPGVMQLMPRTAATFGLTGDRIANTDDNIRVAAEVLKALDKSFAKDVPDKEERQKFVIAAYNSGIAHIRDAISLAKKYGKNPAIWSGNVEDALLMKAKPEFFNDPVCKYGYFRGKETVRYVKDVMSLYERCKKDISS